MSVKNDKPVFKLVRKKKASKAEKGRRIAKKKN